MSELEQSVLSALQATDNSEVSVDAIKASEDKYSLVSQIIPLVEDELSYAALEVYGASRASSDKLAVKLTLSVSLPCNDTRDRAKEIYKTVKGAANELEQAKIRAEMAKLQKRLNALELSNIL